MRGWAVVGIVVVLVGTAVRPVAADGGRGLAAPVGGAPFWPCSWQSQVLPQPADQQGGMVMGSDGGDRWAGQVGRRAAVWDGGRVTVLGDDFSVAQDVSRSGLAVGTRAHDGTQDAMLWGPAGATVLSMPAGLTAAEVTGISDTGVIVGNAWEFVPDADDWLRPHGLAWSVRDPGRVWDLTPAGNSVWLYGVSATGLIAGTLNVGRPTLPGRAVTGTLASGLRVLPSAVAGATTGAIGVAGRYIVGIEQDPTDSRSHPVVWTDGRSPRRLPGVAAAVAVNSDRLIVGISDLGAVAWRGDTPVSLPPETSYAITVNEAGQVGGNVSGRPTVWTCPRPHHTTRPTARASDVRMLGDAVVRR
jgi:hypothetical protein